MVDRIQTNIPGGWTVSVQQMQAVELVARKLGFEHAFGFNDETGETHLRVTNGDLHVLMYARGQVLPL